MMQKIHFKKNRTKKSFFQVITKFYAGYNTHIYYYFGYYFYTLLWAFILLSSKTFSLLLHYPRIAVTVDMIAIIVEMNEELVA